MSNAEELAKYKKLLDDRVITQELSLSRYISLPDVVILPPPKSTVPENVPVA